MSKLDRMTLSRRDLMKAGAASGALLLARPMLAQSRLLAPEGGTGATRGSKLAPGSGLRLLHADLHNHSLLSDGDGDAAAAFGSMRAAGLDVAALTDHAGVGKLQGPICTGCAGAVGIDESEWLRIGELADAANTDDSFVAIRGFEWSSPTLGHMNVWFTRDWTDPLATGGIGAASTAAFLVHEGDLDAATEAEANQLLRAMPDGAASMAGFYTWLASESSRAALGGGLDGIAGFNHPGREGGRFGFFSYDPRLQDRVVSIELFNRGEDYLFEQVEQGVVSPLVECLDAGWRVGALGVSDEHGTNWGFPTGKGRTGIWVKAQTRAGVRDGMLARHFFATRELGLRVDAAANGKPMGSTIAHTKGDVIFALDVDKGPEWTGRRLGVQVLQTGAPLPAVVAEREIVVPATDAAPVTITVPIDKANGQWVLLRITDPSAAADSRANSFPAYRAAGRCVAYPSPFYLT